jgi:SDR family mycofactocin-dependent oxidoreductase
MADSGRVALVTGAARGIGAATVDALCERGYHVLAIDSCESDSPARGAGVTYPLASRADLEAVAAGHPEQVTAQVADVRDGEALTAAAERAVAIYGRLDAAVAAAAVVVGGRPLWQTPQADLRTLIDVDVLGVWNTAAACVPHMLAGPDPRGCRFVAIASAAAHTGLFHLAGYNAAKHAVVGIVKGLAADLVGTGVTACAVSPGSTRTPMLTATADLYGIDDPETLARHQLIHRLIEPREIAEVVALCCSRDGAVLNGSVIQAGGGFGA